MNAGWGLWPRISWNPPDFTLKSGGFHPWNLADFTCEIHPNYKSKCFSKNSSVWWMQGGGFHPWNPVDFTLKSGGFHPEIWWISPMKSADFTQIWPVKSTQNYKSKCFSKNSSVWWMQGGGFHPWNPVDFTLKSGGFHPWNLQISPRYHLWNPPKIIKASVLAKTLQFDECRVGAMTKDFMKSIRFHPEVWWISPMKSGRFHPDFTCEIHPNYKSKCFSKNSSVWWMQGRGYDQGFHEIHQISPWNLVDFTCEIQQSSPRFHLWNLPKIIKASVSAKTLQFDECRVGAMTKDFMKSTGFKSTWNLPDFMKSTRFQNYELLHDDQV